CCKSQSPLKPSALSQVVTKSTLSGALCWFWSELYFLSFTGWHYVVFLVPDFCMQNSDALGVYFCFAPPCCAGWSSFSSRA
ncbi:hypothetical protein B0H10DRAFT_2137864, partial [Mycena sp. CBHHK59/15]